MYFRIITLTIIFLLQNSGFVQSAANIQRSLSEQQIKNELIIKDTVSEEDTTNVEPFGSNLFDGNFAKENENGIEPGYLIQPGDKIMVQIWGVVDFNGTLTVDNQGNLFIPDIGPVQVMDVKNSELNSKIKSLARKTFNKDSFDIYTNLLNVSPIAVYVTGFVNNPGRYAGISSDSLLYFLDIAGGINESLGSYRNIEIIRNGNVLGKADLYEFILEGKMTKINFKDNDTILVKKRGYTIDLMGDVAEPTSLEFKNNYFIGADTLRIIPELANATEITLRGMRRGQPILEMFSIKEYKSKKLQHGDKINIRADSKSNSMTVNIEGAHKGASILSIKRNSTLIDVLNQIEVDPLVSDIKSIHILRKSVARAQKDSILDAVYRLEKSSLLALSHSTGEASIRVQEADLMSQFVEKAKLIETLGRVVTSIDGEQQDILMEEDDIIVIPRKTNIVQVNGEIFTVQAVIYNKDWSSKDYIKQAGGYTSRADKDKLIILRANGEIIIDKKVQIMAGDRILIPPKVTTKMMQNSLDITEILYKIAIAAGVIIRL